MFIHSYLKEHIESMLCPMHDIHPIVEEDWNGIKIICCCKKFEEECLQESERLLQLNNQGNKAKLA